MFACLFFPFTLISFCRCTATLSPLPAQFFARIGAACSFVSSRCVRRSLGRPPDSRRGGGGGDWSAACGDSSLSALPPPPLLPLLPPVQLRAHCLNQPLSPAFSGSCPSPPLAPFRRAPLRRHRFSLPTVRHRIVLLLLHPPYTVHQQMSFKHFQPIATGSANAKRAAKPMTFADEGLFALL